MGLLLDSAHWAQMLNGLQKHKPRLGQTISETDAFAINAIICEALSRVLADPEFKSDLQGLIAKAKPFEKLSQQSIPQFVEFMNLVMAMEDKILRDAKVSNAASRDLQAELRHAAFQSDQQVLNGLEDRIRFCAKLACSPHEVDPNNPIWKRVLRGAQGVSAMAFNGGGLAASIGSFGPVGGAAGPFAGLSIKLGADLLGDAFKGKW